MALSKVIKIADGVTNQFAVSFELGYIREEDITARVGDEVDGTGAPLYRTITFLSPEMLEIAGTIPTAGTQVVFERSVPRDRLMVDYEDGDIINDDNLNTSQKQALMLIHELLDGRFETFDADVDFGGFRITNLGTPVDPTDGASKAYVDSVVQTGANSAAAAAASAGQAAGSAGQALTYAGQSATFRDQSEAWKNKAQEWAISGTIVDSLDYSAKWWANQANTWAQAVNPSQFVLKSGDTMTGPFTLNYGWPALILRKTAEDQANQIIGQSPDGSNRWLLEIGSAEAETGANAGSNLQISAYSDANTWGGYVLKLKRSDGKAYFSNVPQFGIWTPWHSGNLPNPINDAPSDNSTYARKNAAWVKSVGGAIMSDTAPASPENGQKWIRTTDFKEFTWYVDANSAQWVEVPTADVARPASDTFDYAMRDGTWANISDKYARKSQTAAGVGQFVTLYAPAGNGVVLPAGGMWKWAAFGYASTGTNIAASTTTGISPGGTVVTTPSAGTIYTGWAERIS